MNIPNTTGHGKKDEENLERQRETFVASLSHDLKNPTIAQIRALELFLKGNFGKIPPKQKEIIQMVLDSCRYMNAMLCSLLATYRTERGSITLADEEVSISELSLKCIEEIIFLAKDKGMNIKVSDTAQIKTVRGDEVQLKRVIMNLLSNGIKYAYKNTELLVRIYNEEFFTCFSFENNSPYINPEKQEKIFARYVSYSNPNQELGVGLGLYASKKIVEAHDGKMFVMSYKNEKNIFGFKIPNNKQNNANRTVTF